MSVKKLFLDFLEKSGFTTLETRLAAWLGRLYRDHVLKNRPLRGRVGPIYMTRAKIRGRSENLIYYGYRYSGNIKAEHPDVYEVVYHALLYEEQREEPFVLSLFEDQIWMQGYEVVITEYNCILHPGHRFVIRPKGARGGWDADVEIYPVDGKVLHTPFNHVRRAIDEGR